MPSKSTGEALIQATGDDYRLVRIRAAAALAAYPREVISAGLKEADVERIREATLEFM